MQKRLVEELKDLENLIEDYKDAVEEYRKSGQYLAIEKMFHILKDLLLAPDKSFEVIFKGKEYNFFFPSTVSERLEMIEQASLLSRSVIEECCNQYANGKDTWWMVTAFASGIDTLDMQIEIIGKEDHIAQRNEDGSCKQIGLDVKNFQVSQQKPTKEEIDNYLKENNLSELPPSSFFDKDCPCGEC